MEERQSFANAFLSVAVKRRGAELCSVRSAGGVEYLWQADPAVWPRHAPNLFPIVGMLAGDRYTHGGRTYELKQHGFARDLDFELVESGADRLSFRLMSTAETRARYPFEFVLWVNYRLEGRRLAIQYVVQNAGREVMPFSIGAHPGFSLAWGQGDRLEDYFLAFDQPEPAAPRLLGKDHLVSAETVDVMKKGGTLPITATLFDRDALLFPGLRSRKVTLCSHKHARRLCVEFPGFPDLGIWAKPGAPFVCIEPWHGHADPQGASGVLLDKPGIRKLPSGGSFSCEHAIVVEE